MSVVSYACESSLVVAAPAPSDPPRTPRVAAVDGEGTGATGRRHRRGFGKWLQPAAARSSI